jgi:hypothetical protein
MAVQEPVDTVSNLGYYGLALWAGVRGSTSFVLFLLSRAANLDLWRLHGPLRWSPSDMLCFPLKCFYVFIRCQFAVQPPLSPLLHHCISLPRHILRLSVGEATSSESSIQNCPAHDLVRSRLRVDSPSRSQGQGSVLTRQPSLYLVDYAFHVPSHWL